ncbi:MAG: PIG-L family deacetylase [Archangiaceae bacterium]|nr:PIG-L family deacetylase [Archangiaceae bacterium]
MRAIVRAVTGAAHQLHSRRVSRALELDALERLPADRVPSIHFSAHLDDVILSEGATVARAAKSGRHQTPLVVTVATEAPPNRPLSKPARHFHREWKLSPEEVMGARLREERAATRRVGAHQVSLHQTDALYRDGYDTWPSLVGAAAPGDPQPARLRQQMEELEALFPDAVIHAPLGLVHVDHRIVSDAALSVFGGSGKLVLYEDLPYAAKDPAVSAARVRELSQRWRLVEVPQAPLSAREMRVKLRAIDEYASQVPQLFGSSAEMRAMISGHAQNGAARGGVERLWTVEERS